jgi:hypothetical protein
MVSNHTPPGFLQHRLASAARHPVSLAPDMKPVDSLRRARDDSLGVKLMLTSATRYCTVAPLIHRARVVPGLATTVPLVVVPDTFGPWPILVGGGPAAF